MVLSPSSANSFNSPSKDEVIDYNKIKQVAVDLRMKFTAATQAMSTITSILNENKENLNSDLTDLLQQHLNVLQQVENDSKEQLSATIFNSNDLAQIRTPLTLNAELTVPTLDLNKNKKLIQRRNNLDLSQSRILTSSEVLQ